MLLCNRYDFIGLDNGQVSYRRVFKLTQVYFSKEKDAIDVEYELIGKTESQRGLLTYPYESGILLSVDYYDSDRGLTSGSSETFSVTVFQDESNKRLLQLLKVIARLSKNLSVRSHSKELREGIGRELSWTGSVRFDDRAIVREISEAILSIEKRRQGRFVTSFLYAISEIKSFNQLWEDFDNEVLWRIPLLMKFSDDKEVFVRGLLGLPVRILQFKHTRQHLDSIYDELLRKLSLDLPNGKKGDIFEALWFVSRLRQRRGQFQFFLNGMIVTDLEKSKREQDDNEFDVIELLINEEGKAECWIYACSIADDYKSRNEKQLRDLLDHLHEVFPEITIRTWYVIPQDKAAGRWEPREEDTGRHILRA